MKIINVNVSAVSGSTGKIITDLKNNLESFGHNVLVYYGIDKKVIGKDYYNFCNKLERLVNALCSKITGVMYGGYLTFSTLKLIHKIKKEKPDIVHLHCLNGYVVDVFKLLRFLARKRIKTVLTLHAEFMYTGNCSCIFNCNKWYSNKGCNDCQRIKGFIRPLFDSVSYSWNKMRRGIESFITSDLAIVSVSPWLNERAYMSPFFVNYKKNVVLNGVDVNIFTHKIVSGVNYKQLLDSRLPICVYVTASFTSDIYDNKGGHYIISLAEENPNILFVIVANYFSVSAKVLDNLFVWGSVTDQAVLADIYNLANLTIITSRRETFSMVVAESLCCGTPVVGFRAGGPESIAISDFTSFVDYGNLKELNYNLNKMLSKDWDKKYISESAHKIYSSSRMAKEYLNIYNNFVDKC